MKCMKLFAALMAAMLLFTGVMSAALAEGGEDSHYQEQVAKYEAMKNAREYINLYDGGVWYSLKASKLYGRKITGVNPDGSWILGAWELLDNTPSLDRMITVDGRYYAFAYSFDIVWGTDWPYSGIFYSNVDVHPQAIRITLDGTCRMANININVDGKTVVHETNCSSHKEWKP